VIASYGDVLTPVTELSSMAEALQVFSRLLNPQSLHKIILWDSRRATFTAIKATEDVETLESLREAGYNHLVPLEVSLERASNTNLHVLRYRVHMRTLNLPEGLNAADWGMLGFLPGMIKQKQNPPSAEPLPIFNLGASGDDVEEGSDRLDLNPGRWLGHAGSSDDTL
jgi:hypothetical protein